MRAKYLCAWTRHICVLALALSSFACRAPHHEPEPETATRAEVSDALHLQLTLVLERHDKLVLSKSAAAQNEQKVLAELATEIAIRVIRIDYGSITAQIHAQAASSQPPAARSYPPP